ncbi:amidohydrolase [Pseudonocardia sp. CA-107938]|uniref:amidohydrolase n=1 Tax=Pseudonocardia sp. CA-107938 TaxID=3240021 RepID=UPI003D9145EA
MIPPVRTDVHQHVWPASLIDALRARRRPPYLDGWTLHLAGEPPYAVDPADHDPALRADRVTAAGFDRALVSLSSPLGIEYLPAGEAAPLLAAFHEGALALPQRFGVWAAAALDDPDPSALETALDAGCVGLQLPATAVADAAGIAHCGPLLEVLEHHDRPLFVHPGPAPVAVDVPAWWPALVPYVQQMHAAWFAFGAAGRRRHPRLRVCFAMLAGLAPLHGERAGARGGPVAVDPAAFVETSSYGARAVGAVADALGPGLVVAGSDEPYARYTDPLPSADLATGAVARLLHG